MPSKKLSSKKELVVVLENIRSLYNVGSIFRTADGLGFSKIYLCGFTPAPIDGRQKKNISKTALGAEEHILWEKKKSCWRLLEELKKDGFLILGLESGTKKSILLEKLKIKKGDNKIAIILGNEIDGLSSATIKRCDKIIEIPMVGQKESYNVGISFGIAGFWIRQILS